MLRLYVVTVSCYERAAVRSAEVGRVRKLARQGKLPEEQPAQPRPEEGGRPVQMTAQEMEEMAAGLRQQGELWEALRNRAGLVSTLTPTYCSNTYRSSGRMRE